MFGVQSIFNSALRTPRSAFLKWTFPTQFNRGRTPAFTTPSSASGCFSRPRSCFSAGCFPPTCCCASAPTEWPHGWLNVTLGTINTVILALSAITTLLAWVACKVGQFGKFKFFHACTLLLALTFLCIKGYEYHDKWIHYEIKLNDGTFADGHLVEKSADFDLAKTELAKLSNPDHWSSLRSTNLCDSSASARGMETSCFSACTRPSGPWPQPVRRAVGPGAPVLPTASGTTL